MINYFQKKYISDIVINNDFKLNKFEEALSEVIKQYESNHGRRKRIINIPVEFCDITFGVEINKTNSALANIKIILEQIRPRFYFYAHQNIERIDYFERLLQSIKNYHNSDGILVFEFESEDISHKESFINELKEFVEEYRNYVEHKKSIEPDFSNYRHRESNKPVDYEKLNKYIDILIKYSDLIDLDKFKQVRCQYRYSGDLGTSGRFIEGDIHSIKDKLKDLLDSQVMKYSRDVIGIIPAGIADIDIERLYKTDFLFFSVMENDNAIAVHKYLEEEKGRVISEYYASKSSGSYVGD